MELGGNIELTGSIEEQKLDLIVVKKIIGRFTKKLSTQLTDFSGIHITFSTQEDTHTVEVRAEVGSTSITSKETANNRYVALDLALKGLEENIS